MLRVALYGGVGSGKSTAAKQFASLGAVVVDADVIAEELTAADSPQLRQIVAVFGAEIVKEGQLDRALLRRIIYSDTKARKQLDDIMHPPIRAELQRRIENIEAPYCIIVVPLLVEAGMTDLVDCIVVMDCPEHVQISRIVLRDGVSKAEAVKIVRAQATRERRLEVSHRVIDNSLDINHLEIQVLKLHKEWI